MSASSSPSVRRIRVRGYRSLEDVSLEPGSLTVLIGPNGAGKSNVLSLLQLMMNMHTEALRLAVAKNGGASALLHYGPKRTRELSVRIEFAQQDERWNAYEVRLGYAAGDTLIFLDEQVEYASERAPEVAPYALSLGAGHRESLLREDARKPQATTSRVVSAALGGMNFFHFHDTSISSALRTNAPAERDRYLASDGGNLPALLYRLKHSQAPGDQAAWRRIQLLVRRIAPSVRELDPVPVDPNQPDLSPRRLDWLDDEGERFGVHHLSDGTLRAIALVTALAQPAETLPSFVTIDEPELGLHPAALGILASLVRSVSSRCQVLLATQSPALLDHFEPEDVVVVERRSGASHLRRLPLEELEEWLAEYSLSELYDKNLLGGRP